MDKDIFQQDFKDKLLLWNKKIKEDLSITSALIIDATTPESLTLLMYDNFYFLPNIFICDKIQGLQENVSH